MNRSPSSLLLSQCIDGFIKYKTAEGLSVRTVSSYEWTLKKWLEYFEDRPICQVTSDEIRDYLAYLRTEYHPQPRAKKEQERVSKGEKNAPKLATKTVRNFWVVLKSFFTWAAKELKIPNPMAEVQGPKYKTAPVEPFTKAELEELLKACAYARESKPKNRKAFTMRRANARRDEAIILFLLDTGLRASEFSHLKIGDVDMKNGKVVVKHGEDGGAKGGKGRTVFVGKSARRVLWRYLIEREDRDDPDAPLFVNQGERSFNPDSLRHLILRIAENAGVKNAHPHKFRHTMAITYLRSGGDVFTLQALLGHTTLDVVRIYAKVAEMDIERVHRKASPVDNMRL